MTENPADARPTSTPKRRRGWIIGGVAAVVVVALAAFVLVYFQPQKLIFDDKVDEALPGLVTTSPETPTPEPEVEVEVEASAEPAPTDPFAAAADEAARLGAPVAVTSGAFESLEHSTSGTAHLVVLPDGSRLLRIVDLDTDNGPDLRVVLNPAPVGSGDYEGIIELGGLKGNIGSQNYEIPADLDLSTIQSVVIWCERFSVGFGEAPTVLAT